MYIALAGTSNSRQMDPYGVKQGRPFHTSQHTCCILGGDHRKQQAFSYINSIASIKVASYPGLSMDNWHNKKCQDGEFKGLSLRDFIGQVCQDPNFSGILALLLLCNDEKFFKTPVSDASVAVEIYLEKLVQYLKDIKSLGAIKHIILNTALFRQSDFKGYDRNVVYRIHKMEFNSALGKRSPGSLKLKNCIIPFTVIDMNAILPEKRMDHPMYYCKDEVYRKASFMECVHIRATYMEQYLKQVKNCYDDVTQVTPLANPCLVQLSSEKKSLRSRQRSKYVSFEDMCWRMRKIDIN